jgi:formylglycine-generating enzyme required for sulfatase activity
VADGGERAFDDVGRAQMLPVLGCANGCPTMIVVRAGKFTMGSPVNEKDRNNDEGPQREVTIGQPFAVSKTAVTFAEWDICFTSLSPNWRREAKMAQESGLEFALGWFCKGVDHPGGRNSPYRIAMAQMLKRCASLPFTEAVDDREP